jgi:general secretion pathway protein I
MRSRRERGFTLIEVVVAFAILGTTLAVLYGTFESALSRSSHDAHLREGTLIAQSLLARAGSEWPLTEGSVSGSWETYGYKVTQELVAAPTGEPNYTQPLARVNVSVTWTEPAGERNVSIATLKFQPRVTP